MNVKATVLIPTTGDRGLLLPMSVGTVLAQSIQELEVFIIGDGVAENTRQVIHDLTKQDDRIRFFDHPKHIRRGEIYRHAALQQASGEIVCYLCDRDLMLRHHVATLYALLQCSDFAYSATIAVSPGSKIPIWSPRVDPSTKRSAILQNTGGLPLSCVGHTLAMYRGLPHGWRTTPANVPTDRYMWQQFLAIANCRTVSSNEPTILYFRRGKHPGLPTSQRYIELREWYRKLLTPGWQERFLSLLSDGSSPPRIRLYRALRTFLYNHPKWHGVIYSNAAFRFVNKILGRTLTRKAG